MGLCGVYWTGKTCVVNVLYEAICRFTFKYMLLLRLKRNFIMLKLPWTGNPKVPWLPCPEGNTERNRLEPLRDYTAFHCYSAESQLNWACLSTSNSMNPYAENTQIRCILYHWYNLLITNLNAVHNCPVVHTFSWQNVCHSLGKKHVIKYFMYIENI